MLDHNHYGGRFGFLDSPKTDKDGLSQRVLTNYAKVKLKKGTELYDLKHDPFPCPACHCPVSISPSGTLFCRNSDCLLKGLRF